MRRFAAAAALLLAAFPLEGAETIRLQLAPSQPVIREAGMAICTDGVIRDPARARVIRAHDHDHQQRTALTAGLEPLDPDVVPYVVLPSGYSGAHLGDIALVSYNGRRVWAVAGDRGPCEGCRVGRRSHRHRYAFGEGSVALARALGVSGADDGDEGGAPSGVTYVLFPGTAPPLGFPSEDDLLAYIAKKGAELSSRFMAPARPLRLAAAP